MGQPPPMPLDYRGPQPGSREPLVVQFFLGLLVGIGASTLIWWFGMNKLVKSKSPRSETIWIILLFIVPIAKGAAGWACARSRRTRGFGVGLIASIALGCLIFGWSYFQHYCGT